MEDYIRSYTVRLKTIGPVFIGSGETIGKKEYVYYNKRGILYVMDMIKLYKGLKQRRMLQAYEAFMLNNDSCANSLEQFLSYRRITETDVRKWALYSLNMKDVETRVRGKQFNVINCFVKDAYGFPYIPGSSLKGAFRTAIEGSIIQASKLPQSQKMVRDDNNWGSNKWKESDRRITQTVFYRVERPDDVLEDNMLRDRMAGIRISDSSPLSMDNLILCQKIDERPDGLMNTISTYRECIKPGTIIEFNMEIDTTLYDTTGAYIEKAIRRSYSRYEYTYLNKFRDDIMRGKNTLILGGGAGYPSKTVMYDLMEEDMAVSLLGDFFKQTAPKHKHEDDVRKYHISPHTRKRARYKGTLYDMGVCDVSIIEKS